MINSIEIIISKLRISIHTTSKRVNFHSEQSCLWFRIFTSSVALHQLKPNASPYSPDYSKGAVADRSVRLDILLWHYRLIVWYGDGSSKDGVLRGRRAAVKRHHLSTVSVAYHRHYEQFIRLSPIRAKCLHSAARFTLGRTLASVKLSTSPE